MNYPKVLTIAGSDSGGGAGIQADIKAISACGCYAASAVTAVTAQNTLGVVAVEGLSTAIIRQQVEAVLSDIGADAVKIGMLHSAAVVRTVAAVLRDYGVRNVVLDPVMVSTSGHRLIEDEAVAVMQAELLPMARVVTPNLPEAEILLGRPVGGPERMAEAARCMGERYGVSVLLKAGHLVGDELVDVCYDRESGELLSLAAPRVETRNTHGTGCTLSSAVAAYLARGCSLADAVRAGKEYIHAAICAGAAMDIGKGHGPVCHFYRLLQP